MQCIVYWQITVDYVVRIWRPTSSKQQPYPIMDTVVTLREEKVVYPPITGPLKCQRISTENIKRYYIK